MEVVIMSKPGRTFVTGRFKQSVGIEKENSMFRTNKIVLLLFALMLVSGCANRKNISPVPSIKDTTKRNLAAPINCSTAQRDIAVLEEEKASVGKRMLSGVRSVMPIAAAGGILMGDYNDRVKVAVGTYNSDIAGKIADIKKACNLS